MADVYVLASPAPTLYVYPSQAHPASHAALSGPIWQPIRVKPRKRDDDETVLAVLGVI